MQELKPVRFSTSSKESLGKSKEALELEDLRFKAIPQERGGGSADGEAEDDDGENSCYAVMVHAQIEPTEVDEDHDVRHVKAVADAAVKGQRAAAEERI